MLPTGSSQKECFLTPRCAHLCRASSKSLHIEQNCCTQTRFGTCNVALTENSYSWLSQNRRIHTIPYRKLATRSSKVSCHTADLLLYFRYSFDNIVYYIHGFHVSRALRTYPNVAYSRTQFFLCHTPLVIIETILTSKVSIAFVTRNSNTFESHGGLVIHLLHV